MLRKLVFLFLLMGWALAGHAATGDIHIVGSTTMGPMMSQMIVAYREIHTAQTFALTISGSGNGASALAGKGADIALLSRGMKDREIANCIREGVEPERLVLALDGLIPIVHESNPVIDLSLKQLRAIYTGKILDWKALGGPDLAVMPFGRRSDSGSYDVWNLEVMTMKSGSGNVHRVASNAAMVRAVQPHPGGIGYVGLGFAGPGVRQLKVNGVGASAETILDGSYPISRTLNLYIAKDAPLPVRLFVGFVLGSTGRGIVEKAGFVPVR